MTPGEETGGYNFFFEIRKQDKNSSLMQLFQLADKYLYNENVAEEFHEFMS